MWNGKPTVLVLYEIEMTSDLAAQLPATDGSPWGGAELQDSALRDQSPIA